MIHPHALPTSYFGSATMHDRYIYISCITAMTLLLYRMLSYDARRTWLKYARGQSIATGDNGEFSRVYRIQMNTLEHMMFFLPSLWLCAVYFSIAWAQWLGLAWLLGRIWYAVGYFANPQRKPVGIQLSMVAAVALFVCAVAGICQYFKPPYMAYTPAMTQDSDSSGEAPSDKAHAAGEKPAKDQRNEPAHRPDH